MQLLVVLRVPLHVVLMNGLISDLANAKHSESSALPVSYGVPQIMVASVMMMARVALITSGTTKIVDADAY